jgi:hypothetical protein
MQLVTSDTVVPGEGWGVDSILVEGGWMFVGISCSDEGIIKVYNFADASKNHQLTGHKVSWSLNLAVLRNARFGLCRKKLAPAAPNMGCMLINQQARFASPCYELWWVW